ncbi:hypothetical protein [Deinococcus sp.]|uniref:hypothetical protein n=1 Tax=Deinococcus sp. TaxID=47478 RepID=UPI003CC52B96
MSSKFADLKSMRAQRALLQDQQPAPEPVDSEPTADVNASPPQETGVLPGPRRVGRPPGKRSNPDFQQVTVLLESRVYSEVRKRLFDEKKEVSELINELMVTWLKE